MRRHWQQGEAVFSINNLASDVDPRYLIHFHQNIQTVKTRDEALKELVSIHKKKGIIFYLDETKGFLNFERIQIN